eukprot:gene44984-55024_t
MIASASADHVTFFKRGRRGQVVKYVREKYRREDTMFGALRGTVVTPENLQKLVQEAQNHTVVFLDTNVALHEIDLLEQESPVTSLMVACQTMLQELRRLNFSAYKRMQELISNEKRNIIFYPNELSVEAKYIRTFGESEAEACTKAIVQAAKIYHQAVSAPGAVIFLSNDPANQAMAASAGIATHDMRSFLLTFAADRPELLDFVHAAHPLGSPLSAGAQPAIYPEHRSAEELAEGLRVRRFLRGALRVKKDDWSDCYVIVREPSGGSGGGRSQRVVVHVQGSHRVNRALDGDIVA